MKHNAFTYKNGQCRCAVCVEAQRLYCAEERRARRAARVLVGDRLVAPLGEDKHGKPATYTNHSCRCARCTDAWTAVQRTRRTPRGGAA